MGSGIDAKSNASAEDETALVALTKRLEKLYSEFTQRRVQGGLPSKAGLMDGLLCRTKPLQDEVRIVSGINTQHPFIVNQNEFVAALGGLTEKTGRYRVTVFEMLLYAYLSSHRGSKHPYKMKDALWGGDKATLLADSPVYDRAKLPSKTRWSLNSLTQLLSEKMSKIEGSQGLGIARESGITGCRIFFTHNIMEGNTQDVPEPKLFSTGHLEYGSIVLPKFNNGMPLGKGSSQAISSAFEYGLTYDGWRPLLSQQAAGVHNFRCAQVFEGYAPSDSTMESFTQLNPDLTKEGVADNEGKGAITIAEKGKTKDDTTLLRLLQEKLLDIGKRFEKLTTELKMDESKDDGPLRNQRWLAEAKVKRVTMQALAQMQTGEIELEEATRIVENASKETEVEKSTKLEIDEAEATRESFARQRRNSLILKEREIERMKKMREERKKQAHAAQVAAALAKEQDDLRAREQRIKDEDARRQAAMDADAKVVEERMEAMRRAHKLAEESLGL